MKARIVKIKPLQSYKISNRLPITLFLILLFPLTVQAVLIRLETTKTHFNLGETFIVNVLADDVFVGLSPTEELLAFGFDVYRDFPVRLIDAVVLPPFTDDSSLFPITDVAGSAFPGIPNEPANNTINLALLVFEAQFYGTTDLGVVSRPAQLSEGLIFFEAGKHDISEFISIRVPDSGATIMLLTLGLIGISFIRLKCTKQCQ